MIHPFRDEYLIRFFYNVNLIKCDKNLKSVFFY